MWPFDVDFHPLNTLTMLLKCLLKCRPKSIRRIICSWYHWSAQLDLNLKMLYLQSDIIKTII